MRLFKEKHRNSLIFRLFLINKRVQLNLILWENKLYYIIESVSPNYK